MDGVLLEPRGYHTALSETVALVGRALGYRQVTLTTTDIEVLESVDVTSEWDSTAICAALLMRGVWTISPNIFLPSAPPLPQFPMHDLSIPDFQAFFRSLPRHRSRPLQAAERSLLTDGSGYTETQASSLRTILRGARKFRGSLTHLLFQEFVLGSQLFQDSYGTEPHLHVAGYLLTRDRPTLPTQTREELLDWLGKQDQHAAVFTNRPSKPEKGSPGTPEAELGLAVTELEMLPLVGQGELALLADERGMAPDSLLKPCAAHALVAMRRAIGDPLEVSLHAAAALALDQVGDPTWETLSGAEIFVFEDSAKGLESVAAAQACLDRVEVSIQTTKLGVTESVDKRQSLEAAGAEVFPNLEQALCHIATQP